MDIEMFQEGKRQDAIGLSHKYRWRMLGIVHMCTVQYPGNVLWVHFFYRDETSKIDF